jgi:hypothetical protein
MAPDFGAHIGAWSARSLVVQPNQELARLLHEEVHEYTKRPSLF